MARQSLAQWIVEALSDPERTDGEGKPLRCTALSLMHSQGMGMQELLSIKLTRARDEQELANLFERRARNYAQDLPGVQTFCLLAFYEGSNEPQARRVFSVTPEADGSNLVTEAPNPQGELQQKMRQKDDLHSVYIGGIASLTKMQSAFIAEMGMQAVRLMGENRQQMQMLTTLLVERESKAHEYQMDALKYERSTMVQKQVMQAIPAIANQLTGREVFPQALADTQLIELLAEKASPELLTKLGGAIANESPELVGALMSRLSQINEQKAKERAENSRIVGALKGKPEDELQ